MKCCICERDWPDQGCHRVHLNDLERAYVLKTTGKEAPPEYVYCAPCWKLLSDRKQGAEFIAGTMQASLRAQGHPKADEIGKRFRAFLLSKAKKSVS